MSDAKHTPGPWATDPEDPSDVRASDGELIATAYALAKLVVEFFGDDDIEDLLDADIRLRDAARALIAKAEVRA